MIFVINPNCRERLKRIALTVTAMFVVFFTVYSGGFRGGRAGSPPPPLGDGLTPSGRLKMQDWN